MILYLNVTTDQSLLKLDLKCGVNLGQIKEYATTATKWGIFIGFTRISQGKYFNCRCNHLVWYYVLKICNFQADGNDDVTNNISFGRSQLNTETTEYIDLNAN